MSFLRFGMCQLRNKAAGMSSHSIREFKVMIKRLKLPPKGEWIMVNEVEGAPRPAVSSICTSRAPPASIPEQSAARNIDAFAKPGLRLSLRASRIAMNPRRRPHTSPATAPSRVAVTEPSAVAPKAPITVVAGTTTRKGPRRSQRVVFMVDTEVPPIRVDGRTSPVRRSFPCYTTVAAVGVGDRYAKPALMVFGPWRVLTHPRRPTLHHTPLPSAPSPSLLPRRNRSLDQGHLAERHNVYGHEECFGSDLRGRRLRPDATVWAGRSKCHRSLAWSTLTRSLPL